MLWETSRGAWQQHLTAWITVNLQGFADDLRQFAWTMAVRTRAIREQLVAAFEMLLAKFGEWSRTSAAVECLDARSFDEEIERTIQKLPPQLRLRAATVTRSPAVRDSMLNWAKSNFSSLTGTVLDMVQSRGLVAKSAKDGQVRALARVLDARAAPDSFRPAAWHLISCSSGSFVLGDSCVVARVKDGSLGSLIKAGRDWREIYLPISPRQVLAATSTRTGASLDYAAINRASAKFALRYTYASCTGPDIDNLQAVISTGDPLITQDRAAQIMREVENESADRI